MGVVFQVLIPKLKEPDPNPNVVINIMAAIGELAQVKYMYVRLYLK